MAGTKKPFLKKVKDNRTLLLMCLPAVVFFIVFNYCPLPGVYIAFTNYNFRDGIFGSPFVGLKNFEFLIQSGELWKLTRNTLLYNVVFIVLGNVVQITLAVMLNEVRNKYFKKVSQTIMFLPYFISVVLIGAIAFNILNYDTGALNTLLRETGGDPVKIYSMAGIWPFIIIFCQMLGNNSQLFQTTDIIETFVYRTMTTQNNFSTSSAVGLYQSIFGFALVMFSNWLVKRIDPDYALF